MAYTANNYKSGAELKRDWLAGMEIRVFQPGGYFPLKVGNIALEGPHYPAPHKWYAKGYQEGGILIRLDLPGCKKENERRARINKNSINPDDADGITVAYPEK